MSYKGYKWTIITQMTTKKAATALILATFALMTTGLLAIPSAFAQDGDQDFATDVDTETGSTQVADATSEQNEENRQGNLISQVEELLNTQALQGDSGGGGGAGAGVGSGVASDSEQGQSADDASQGNAGFFGDDLGVSTAFNVGQVNVDLRDLVDLTPPSTSAEQE
jgi:hypothetical protein